FFPFLRSELCVVFFVCVCVFVCVSLNICTCHLHPGKKRNCAQTVRSAQSQQKRQRDVQTTTACGRDLWLTPIHHTHLTHTHSHTHPHSHTHTHSHTPTPTHTSPSLQRCDMAAQEEVAIPNISNPTLPHTRHISTHTH